MTTHPSPSRRVGALLAIPALLVLSACGMKQEYAISKEGTVDLAFTITDDSGSGYLTESSCSADSADAPDGIKVTFSFTDTGDTQTCVLKATDVPLSEFDGSEGMPTIKHTDGTYTFDRKAEDSSSSTDGLSELGDVDVTASVTFPGKVIEANGTVDGSTVTWTDLVGSGQDLHAVGEDGSTTPWGRWLGIGAVALLVVAGVVGGVLLLARRRTPAAGQPVPAPYAGPGGTVQAPGAATAYGTAPNQPYGGPQQTAQAGAVPVPAQAPAGYPAAQPPAGGQPGEAGDPRGAAPTDPDARFRPPSDGTGPSAS